MRDLLINLKLIDSFETEIPLDKSTFTQRLFEKVDKGSIGTLFSFMDIFSSSPNDYQGHVGYDNFEIRKKGSLSNPYGSIAKIKADCFPGENQTLIIGEVSAFSSKMIFFYSFALVFYIIFFLAVILSGQGESSLPVFVLPFMMVHAVFMFGIPYFIMRASVRRLKKDLERDLYFLTK